MPHIHKNYSFKSKNGRVSIHTSNKELKDLLVAWLFVSFAFAIARTVGNGITFASFFSIEFIVFILISALTVGLAFLLHELAHKIVAQTIQMLGRIQSRHNNAFTRSIG